MHICDCVFWNTYLCLCVLVHISVNNPKHTTTNMSHHRPIPEWLCPLPPWVCQMRPQQW